MGSSQQSGDFDRELVILVEDSESDQTLFKTAYERCGIRNPLTVLGNGLAARHYLEGSGPYQERVFFPLPSAILIDLKMPCMGGFELLEWMNTRDELQHITRIVFTHSTLRDDSKRAFELGCRFFLTKPARFGQLKELLITVFGWLRQSHYDKRVRRDMNVSLEVEALPQLPK